MQNKPKLGFSLIELLVVILVIGIFVIGGTQGKKILNSANLASAKSLTAGSPVATIDNLVMWLETTSQKSFDDSEKVDTPLGADGTITTWNDLNPKTTSPNNATQGGASSLRPRYVSNGINGLPAVNFDGTNDYFLTKNLTTDDYTVFIILQTKYPGLGTSTSEAWAGSSVLSSDVGGIANDAVPIAIAGGYAKTFVGAPGNTITSTVRIDNNVANLVTVTRLKSSGAFSLYVNGTNKVSATGTPRVSLSAAPNLTIGNDSALSKAYQGAVSEIIVFNSFLSNTQRTIVEGYLKSKWGIK